MQTATQEKAPAALAALVDRYCDNLEKISRLRLVTDEPVLTVLASSNRIVSGEQAFAYACKLRQQCHDAVPRHAYSLGIEAH